jgi:hypothetical protein
VITGFPATPGDFLYLAVSFSGGTDQITSVADTVADAFDYVAGEFQNNQSVALYAVPSERGGTDNITVTISARQFGICTVGQLNPGTMVGTIGSGASVSGAENLTVTNDAGQTPALLMALFGATRPTGASFVSVPTLGDGWEISNQATGFTFNGDSQFLYVADVETAGSVAFTWQVGNTQTPSISGVVVELYLAR